MESPGGHNNHLTFKETSFGNNTIGNINYEEGLPPEPLKYLDIKQSTQVLHDKHTGFHRRFLNEEIKGFLNGQEFEDEDHYMNPDHKETEVSIPV